MAKLKCWLIYPTRVHTCSSHLRIHLAQVHLTFGIRCSSGSCCFERMDTRLDCSGERASTLGCTVCALAWTCSWKTLLRQGRLKTHPGSYLSTNGFSFRLRFRVTKGPSRCSSSGRCFWKWDIITLSLAISLRNLTELLSTICIVAKAKSKYRKCVVQFGPFRLGWAVSYWARGYQTKYSFADCSIFKSICSICACAWYLPHAISNTARTGCSPVHPQTRAATCQSRGLCRPLSSRARVGPRRPIWTCATMTSFVFYNLDMFSPWSVVFISLLYVLRRYLFLAFQVTPTMIQIHGWTRAGAGWFGGVWCGGWWRRIFKARLTNHILWVVRIQLALGADEFRRALGTLLLTTARRVEDCVWKRRIFSFGFAHWCVW